MERRKVTAADMKRRMNKKNTTNNLEHEIEVNLNEKNERRRRRDGDGGKREERGE
jgi:hypothetical protein